MPIRVYWDINYHKLTTNSNKNGSKFVFGHSEPDAFTNQDLAHSPCSTRRHHRVANGRLLVFAKKCIVFSLKHKTVKTDDVAYVVL